MAAIIKTKDSSNNWETNENRVRVFYRLNGQIIAALIHELMGTYNYKLWPTKYF